MHNTKHAFTMIELVFVIVILGVLAAVAVPKFSATRDDAIASEVMMEINVIVSDISNKVVSSGQVAEDFSTVSDSLKGLVDSGKATVGVKSTILQVDGVNCIQISATKTRVYETLNVTAVVAGAADNLCAKVQNAVSLISYDIPLTGAIIVD